MNRTFVAILCLLGGSLTSLTALAQTTRYVSTSGSDMENLCSASANPCRTIGRAVDVAVPGDPIQIAAGAYTETLTIGKSLSILGEDRDNTIIQAHTLAGMASRNVIRLTGGAAVEVDIANVTIRHGRADGEVDLANLPNISGGGIFNDGVALSLERVNLSGNWALLGGGMINVQSSPVLNDVVFSGNTSLSGGGGMVNFQNSSPMLTDVVFSGNTTAVSDGGGMLNSANSSPVLTNAVFAGNFAGFNGGGMYNGTNSDATLINVLFSANWAEERGGGMHNLQSAPTLVNVTFNANTALNGGAISNVVSDPALTNVIIWNNAAGESTSSTSPSIYNDTSTPVIAHSLVELSGGSGAGWDPLMGTDGGNNLDADPMFVDELDPEADALTLGGNLRLNAGSPAVDAGDDTPFGPGGVAEDVSTDLDGLQRIFGPAADMGPYEFQPDPTVFVDRFEAE